MSRTVFISLGLAIAVIAAGSVAKPAVYPAKGQSAAQQKKDDGECYTWAKGNTGIDPAAPAAAPASPPPPGGQRIAGAARGAIVGGVIGGDEGARTGAAVGVIAGGAKARQQRRAQEQQSQQQSQQQIDTFNRAWGACMEGRGYTVK